MFGFEFESTQVIGGVGLLFVHIKSLLTDISSNSEKHFSPDILSN